MSKKFLYKFSAFTLAEVLIVLGIIGIVAAMTIPTLMNKIQDETFKSGLKSSYSILAQAVSRAAYDNSGSIADVCTSRDYNCFRDFMGQYLTYIKKCDIGVAGCWTTENIKTLYNFDTVGKKTYTSIATSILKNGTSIAFQYGDSTCTSNWASQALDFSVCGIFTIDVNGPQKPNTIGRDEFLFWVLKDRVLPFGSGDVFDGRNGDKCNINKNFNVNGYGCAAKYLM